jgi:hypothetical protein
LHETLTNGCLRVFDPDFVPVYRDVASGDLRKKWQLGVVEKVDDRGRPTRLRRCTATKWVSLKVLARAASPVVSGRRFALADDGFAPKNGRDVYREDARVVADEAGRWVVHVSDDAARSGKTHFCVVGRR